MERATPDVFQACRGVAMLASVGNPDEPARQAAILRCIVGNPFRPTSVVEPTWLSWNGGIAAKLATEIYDVRTFDRLPLLADALEDAGCSDGELLRHLRGSTSHSRGCWVVDRLLGKQ
jgi:hypothetical protein